MKSKASKYYRIERELNAALAEMPADHRPEMSTRRKVARVAYQARGVFQATDASGNVESMPLGELLRWLKRIWA